MKMNLKIFDFEGNSYDTNVSIDDVESITVVVVSGDEKLDVHMKNGEYKHIDVIDIIDCRRIIDFFNGAYLVLNHQLEDWNNRADSYDWVRYSDRVIGSF